MATLNKTDHINQENANIKDTSFEIVKIQIFQFLEKTQKLVRRESSLNKKAEVYQNNIYKRRKTQTGSSTER